MRIDTSQVRRLQVDLSKAPASVRAKAPAAVKKTLFDIEADGKVGAPKDTGNLAGSISSDIDPDGMGGVVGPTANYGAHVEYGTAPHVIRAKPGRMLRFPGRNGMVYVRSVNHPGTAPQPYMGPAFDRRAPGLEDALGDAGESIL